MELLTTLGINWQLLVAQLINFFILIVVLTYFIYKPFLRLLDDRRERVRKSMEDAKHVEQQRRDMEMLRTEQLRKVDQETVKILEESKHQGEAARREILAKAQQEADHILQKAKQQLDEERGKMLSELEGSVSRVIVKLATKVLEREFSSQDQARIAASVEKSIPTLLR